jgi:3-methyladenine DNA glycosylase AlkD
MILSGAKEARRLGGEIAEEINKENISSAYKIIFAYLNDRNPFRLLDLVGGALTNCPRSYLDPFLDMVAEAGSQGGWVVIASALHSLSGANARDIFNKCKGYIIQADVWYACDIFGERVTGPALLSDFNQTLKLFSSWRCDSNPWVRRAVGVAVHFWAKRTRGEEPHHNNARILLDFISPLFEEKDMRAAKGVGWGLKTIGRYYPLIAYEWLTNALVVEKRQPLVIVKRKALTYLPDEMKQTFYK